MGTRRITKWMPLGISVLVFMLYTPLAVLRYQRGESNAYDLGIFAQAVRAYAELRAPISEIKGFHILGDHFHPILVLLAPAYRAFPTPVTLLVAQAALIAISVIPVIRLARDRLGHTAGACVGAAYGFSFGLQQAIKFDFHEVAFAVPLLAFCMEALARQNWRRAALLSMPLLLVKEDQAVIVAAIGCYLLLRRRWVLGSGVTLAGVGSGALIVAVIIPHFHPDGIYPYTTAGPAPSVVEILHRLLTPADKYGLIFALLLACGFTVIFEPIALIAVPPLLLRFWADKPAYYSTIFHYNSVLMPILFVAAVEGARRLSVRFHDRLPYRHRPRRTLGVILLASTVLATAFGQPLRSLAQPRTWIVPPEVTERMTLLAEIPDGARVSADNRIVPYLVARCTVSMFPDSIARAHGPMWDPATEWVVAKSAPEPFPVAVEQYRAQVASLPARGFTLVTAGAGVLIFRKTMDQG